MTTLFAPSSAKGHRVTWSALVMITGLSWAYLVLLSVRMGDMGSSLAMPMTSAWTTGDVVLMWTMWAVMMAGMMLPSAAPMIGAYRTTIGSPTATLDGSTPWFVAGYLAAWSGFAVLATVLQWSLHQAALVDAMGAPTSRWLGASLLAGAGAYQLTASKHACLRRCQSPLGFLLNEWRDRRWGAAVMGVRHGAFCIGCCWALMATLFVLGVMNLWWVGLLAAVVLAEKLVPGRALSRTLGVGLIGWAVLLAVGLGTA